MATICPTAGSASETDRLEWQVLEKAELYATLSRIRYGL
jgi:hypothetical protein